MTLKKWIESLEEFADYTYYLYMGEGFYTELTLDEVINGRHSELTVAERCPRTS